MTSARSRSTGFVSIESSRPVSFGIDYQPDALASGSTLASLLSTSERTLFVLDRGMLEHHGDRVSAFIQTLDHDSQVLVLDGDERNKTLAASLSVVDAMDRARIPRRSSPVVAIGGGVVCDVVGFAASIYRRGVPYIRVPTTFLAQVDVAVAIKTGVDYNGYRNRLGSFWAPEATIVDPWFLTSQPREQIAQGLGEVIKLALVCSRPLFEALEDLPDDWSPRDLADPDRAGSIMSAAIFVMAEQLRGNLWEDDLRRAVDFGHIFSPLVEMRTGLHHGFAVALDCLLSTTIAIRRGLLDPAVRDRLLAVMRRCGLPLSHPGFTDTELLWESLADSTRHRNNNQHAPVPLAIGSCGFLEDIGRDELDAAVSDVRATLGSTSLTG